MDGIKVGGGKVGIDEDMADGMQCSEHPYRNNPGGICAFCLQEKLGKLVSSSFPIPLRGSPSSSSSPSFRSDVGATSSGIGASNAGSLTSTSLSLAVRPTPGKAKSEGGYNCHYQEYRRSKIPFLLAKKKKKMVVASSSSSSSLDRDIVFKRSKSTTTAPGRRSTHFLDTPSTVDRYQDFSPRRRGFWSFLYLSSSSKPKVDKAPSFSSAAASNYTTEPAGSLVAKPRGGGGPKCQLGTSNLSRRVGGDVINVVVEGEDVDDMSPNSKATASASSFERKVSRSRSVGCGSRSFSGDFFERISTGFGDCTLRRVESQREGKPKVATGANMKERVRCGGIFGGFIITSSSSSSSSSSYWVSSSAEEINGKPTAGNLAHGRARSWGWAFASPMRAFSKPAASSKDGKRDHNKNTTPNLAAMPSLLAVRG